jgi:putative membrane protein
MIITDKERLLIKNLIKEAEKKTVGEVVPIIVHRSDEYPAAHFRGAIIVSFIFSLILYYSPFSIINPIYFLWIQIPGLFLGYQLAHFSQIKKLLIFKNETEEEVTQRAFQSFFHYNLHVTSNHNGVLIFISLLERKIKIIADVGISSKVNQKVWDEIVYEFTEQVKKDQFVESLSKTIVAVSNVLESHFPSNGSVSKNELSNDVIIEDK